MKSLNRTNAEARFYSGESCTGKIIFKAIADDLNDTWDFSIAHCSGHRNILAKSVTFSNDATCYGSYPNKRYMCDSYGWTQVGRQ